MPTIKQVVNDATQKALAKGQYGHFEDRSNEMRSYIIHQAEANGFTKDDVEDFVNSDLGEYCDQQLEMVWPHDAGEA